METSKRNNIHIVGLCGSLRRNSINRGLLLIAKQQLPPHVTFTLADISNLPFFNEAMENSLPEPVNRLKELAASADGFVISTPEYNLSITAVLKNAIEWLSRQPLGRPMAGKPATIMGASPLGIGTSQAQAHLRDILFGLDVQLVNRPILMVGNSREKFDEQGNLTDAATTQLINQLMVNLIKRIEMTKSN